MRRAVLVPLLALPLLGFGRSCVDITSPGPGAEFLPDETIAFRASARGFSGSPIDHRWRSSLQGSIGTGAALDTSLRAGLHDVRVTATDGAGTAEDTTVVKVAPYEDAMTYTGGYRNLVIGGRTTDGREFALVAGKHSQNFPFYHPRSKFDNLLLKVGETYVHATGRVLEELEVRPYGDTLRVAFSGAARRLTAMGAEGAAVYLDLSFDLKITHYVLDDLVPVWNLVLLRWAPRPVVAVHGSPRMSLDGSALAVDAASVFGHYEQAFVTGIKGAPPMGYRYWAAADIRNRTFFLSFTVDPTGDWSFLNGPGNVVTGAVALSFLTKFVPGSDRPLKLPVPFAQFAIRPTADRHGPTIDLGAALLRRTVTRFDESSLFGGDTFWGLEEEFLP